MSDVVATVQFTCTILETLTDQVDGSTSPEVIHDGFNRTFSLDENGSGGLAVVTEPAVFTKALVAGAGTINLTSVPATGGGNKSANGLKVQLVLFTNPTTNVGSTITIAPGASNAYELFGSGNELVIPKGCTLQFYFHDQLADIDGTHKEIDLAGTGTDILNCIFLFG